jgi:hypothetical protein
MTAMSIQPCFTAYEQRLGRRAGLALWVLNAVALLALAAWTI